MAIIFVSLFFMASISGVQEQVDQIDQRIEKLTEEKNSKEAEAARAEDEGMQWEFEDDQQLEARGAFEREDAAKERIKELDAEIESLKKRKAKLLNEGSVGG